MKTKAVFSSKEEKLINILSNAFLHGRLTKQRFEQRTESPWAGIFSQKYVQFNLTKLPGTTKEETCGAMYFFEERKLELNGNMNPKDYDSLMKLILSL
jgi:hypothetical protein